MDDTNEQAIAEMEVATESNRGGYTDSHVDVDALNKVMNTLWGKLENLDSNSVNEA